MKTLLTPIFVIALIIMSSMPSNAQIAFNLENSCSSENAYPKVTIPAMTFLEILRSSHQGIPEKDACITSPPSGTLEGYQADFDGDGSEEIWLLYHTGSIDAGCDVVVILSPIGGGKYQFHDMLSLPEGKALIRPIIILDNGVQMYAQNSYKLPDGTPETKGTVLGYRQGSIIILTSWTQKNFEVEGKRYNLDIRAAFLDQNFDITKELILQYNIYDPALGTSPKKSLIDQYVLTLDFVPMHLRYAIYDSVSLDKLQEAEKMAKSGERMLGRDATRTNGIIKIKEALRINPYLTSTRVKFGKFLLFAGKYGDAENALLPATILDPKYPRTYKLLGDTYLRLNDLQKALAAYTTFLELDPDSKDRRQVEHNIKQITIPKARVR